MKKITQILLILLTTVFCYQTYAQSYAVKGGLNLATILDKDDDVTYSDDYMMNAGFHVGLVADFPISSFLSFEPGVLLTTKGVKMEEEMEELGITFKMTGESNLFYVDVPLTLKGTHDPGTGLKIYGAAGPYVGMGLSGKTKLTVEALGEKESEERDIKWGNDENEDNLKRLDFGLTVGAGVEIQSVIIGVSYDYGLANILTNQDNGAVSRHRVLRFSVGYRFGNNVER